ncbi:MAG: class I SAM-dependent methyltransferase [Pseudonocardiaceae bacterium]
MTGQIDTIAWAQWLRRWDAQQTGYIPDREEAFALMLDVLGRLDAAPGRLLDLACGPGSLADRALRRFPDAVVFGLDIDPVMLELGRRTLGDRVRWVEADLRSPDWAGKLVGAEFDAIVSATALHWLDSEHVPHVAQGLAELLRPGGVFLNLDSLLTDPGAPRLAELTRELSREAGPATGAAFEDFYAWWEALAAEPALAALFTERDRRFGPRRHGTGTAITEWEQALRAAGFAEVAPLTQALNHRLLAAIR